METVKTFEKPGSDFEPYVTNMERIYSLQLEKINFMKMRLNNFKVLLKEENDISQKILKMNEMMKDMYENSFHTQSTVMNNFDEEF